MTRKARWYNKIYHLAFVYTCVRELANSQLRAKIHLKSATLVGFLRAGCLVWFIGLEEEGNSRCFLSAVRGQEDAKLNCYHKGEGL